jgi:hypothetical protein
VTADAIIYVIAAAISLIALIYYYATVGESQASAPGRLPPESASLGEDWEESRYPGITKLDEIFHTNIGSASDVSEVLHVRLAGCSYANSDGSSRREYIKRCEVLEELEIRLEPDNPVDPLALAVHRQTGEQLGYIDHGTARKMRKDGGRAYTWKAVFRYATRSPDSRRIIAGAAIYLVRVQIGEPVDSDWRSTMNSATYLSVDCSRCQAGSGLYCRTKSGSESLKPHAVRLKAFQKRRIELQNKQG